MGVTPEELISFMGATPVSTETATTALTTAEALIGGYCRGCHVDGAGEYRDGIKAVVITVGARIAANPAQVTIRDSAGPFTRARGQGFSGFTLAELAVLNRYRKRAKG